VRFEIQETDIAAYQRAAEFLNVNGVDLLSVQHEYGIFGGKAGINLLALLRELRMPVVSTLHTILSEPSRVQREAMDGLLNLSERVVVMSECGRELLRHVHGVPARKIDLIPHGIPAFPVPAPSKDRLGLEGRRVILTFGLLSPDKGVEHVIDALPAVVERHPDVAYVLLGATHPHVKERQGEVYRIMLERRARSLGVDSNLVFHNRFVSNDELTQFLAVADVYVTPYLKMDQITSGTLAYAVGFGKAVISTPYRYARELLDDGRGVLFPPMDSGALARELIELLDDDEKRLALGQRAAAYGQDMGWPRVAASYMEVFQRAKHDHSEQKRSAFQARTLAHRPEDLPEFHLTHLESMSEATGLLQHAAFNVPRYEAGFCLDDNARALVTMALAEESEAGDTRLIAQLTSRYLAFVRYAFNQERGRFRNFMSYTRDWLEDVGSEDSHGRAVWGLGTLTGRTSDFGRRTLARDLFHAALPATAQFTSPRAWAFSLLGIDEYLRAFDGDTEVQSVRATLGARLLSLFERSQSDDWPWFEDRLSYCNARMPQALIATGARLGNDVMLSAGLSSLEWLGTQQRSRQGYFAPIGTNGFFVRGEQRATFDQQPIEAAATVAACAEAHRATTERIWTTRARHAFNWFVGQNDLQQVLYDPVTGGCRDGLHEGSVNENQGAESTLAFLLSLLEMRALDLSPDNGIRPALRVERVREPSHPRMAVPAPRLGRG
jgi:glycosyltransferase involved in cell wall biosynthesis